MSSSVLIWLAQTNTARATRELLIIAAIGLPVILILGLLGLLAYRMLLRRQQAQDTQPAFTLADLRRMHKAGQLTDEEFVRAKAAIIGAVSARSETDETAPTTENPEPGSDPDDDAATDNQKDASDDEK